MVTVDIKNSLIKYWSIISSNDTELARYYGNKKRAYSQALRDGWLVDGNKFQATTKLSLLRPKTSVIQWIKVD